MLALAFSGCSKHSSAAGASRLENIDLVSLTNAMTAETGEPVIGVEKLDGKYLSFLIATGSPSEPHHYVATWARSKSKWGISRVVK